MPINDENTPASSTTVPLHSTRERTATVSGGSVKRIADQLMQKSVSSSTLPTRDRSLSQATEPKPRLTGRELFAEMQRRVKQEEAAQEGIKLTEKKSGLLSSASTNSLSSGDAHGDTDTTSRTNSSTSLQSLSESNHVSRSNSNTTLSDTTNPPPSALITRTVSYRALAEQKERLLNRRNSTGRVSRPKEEKMASSRSDSNVNYTYQNPLKGKSYPNSTAITNEERTYLDNSSDAASVASLEEDTLSSDENNEEKNTPVTSITSYTNPQKRVARQTLYVANPTLSSAETRGRGRSYSAWEQQESKQAQRQTTENDSNVEVTSANNEANEPLEVIITKTLTAIKTLIENLNPIYLNLSAVNDHILSKHLVEIETFKLAFSKNQGSQDSAQVLIAAIQFLKEQCFPELKVIFTEICNLLIDNFDKADNKIIQKLKIVLSEQEGVFLALLRQAYLKGELVKATQEITKDLERLDASIYELIKATKNSLRKVSADPAVAKNHAILKSYSTELFKEIDLNETVSHTNNLFQSFLLEFITKDNYYRLVFNNLSKILKTIIIPLLRVRENGPYGVELITHGAVKPLERIVQADCFNTLRTTYKNNVAQGKANFELVASFGPLINENYLPYDITKLDYYTNNLAIYAFMYLRVLQCIRELWDALSEDQQNRITIKIRAIVQQQANTNSKSQDRGGFSLIQDLLIAPSQRCPQTLLTLKEMCKYFPSDQHALKEILTDFCDAFAQTNIYSFKNSELFFPDLKITIKTIKKSKVVEQELVVETKYKEQQKSWRENFEEPFAETPRLLEAYYHENIYRAQEALVAAKTYAAIYTDYPELQNKLKAIRATRLAHAQGKDEKQITLAIYTGDRSLLSKATSSSDEPSKQLASSTAEEKKHHSHTPEKGGNRHFPLMNMFRRLKH